MRLLFVVAMTVGIPVPALAALGVGLYAPDIPFASPVERLSYIKGIAAHISASLGTPVEGRAYKLARDFEQDVRARKIQFAVVGGTYLSSRPGFVVLAHSRLTSGRTASTWTLMAAGKTTLAALKGKRVQLPWQGPRTVDLLQNAVLGSTLDVTKYFKVERSPDLASAVAAVRFKRAEAVLAPTDTSGLVPVLGGISVPGPAFVTVDKRAPAEQVGKVAKAVMSYGASMATIQGWRSGGPAPYRALAGLCTRRVLSMVLAPTPGTVLRSADLVDLGQLKPVLPKLEDLYWIP